MDATFQTALNGFSFVVQLAIGFDRELAETNLVLVLSNDAEMVRRRTFWFQGLTNLRLDAIGGALLRFHGLQITDVADRDLDRIRYAVEDVERGSIAFLCRDITCQDE